MFKCSNVQMLKYSNVQMSIIKCQMFLRSFFSNAGDVAGEFPKKNWPITFDGSVLRT